MPRATKIFRLFVSSTFTDLKKERSALQERVFPILDKVCQKYGAKFQAIDLRWGVSEEAQYDHKTLDICLQELNRCLDLSPRPNFLILLGNRYGWRPVPTNLSKNEVDVITNYLKTKNEDDYLFFKEWYLEDRNAVPVTYNLKPRRGEYLNQEIWTSIEKRLRKMFDGIIKNVPLNEETKEKYNLSATEHEIRSGAFKQADADEHVFAFFRELNSIPKDAQNEFLDINENGQVNNHSETLIKKLKSDLKDFLPKKNISEYQVDWIDEKFDKSYLDDFCKDVLDKLIPVIEAECKKIEEIDFVAKENEMHEHFANMRSKNFIGRETLFQKVYENIESRKNQPMIINGLSGSGKSAFAAELYKRLKRDFPQGVHVARFIGASSFGMNAIELLQTILTSISPTEQQSILELNKIDDLLLKQVEIFKNVTSEKPIYIIIDAIDQMSDVHLLPKWFEQNLPENVYIIVTVATDQKAFPILKGIFPANNFLSIAALMDEEGEKILCKWLEDEHRTLQPKQMSLILDAFKECPLPLFLKLAFEEVKLWTSYKEVNHFPTSIEEVVKMLINRLSDNVNHGEIFVRNTLGLLESSRNGLDEGELIDLLSETKEVMDDFLIRSKHDYINKKLPIVVWARLYSDLEPYLIEKNADGRILYSFYHRQIEETVKKSYSSKKFHKAIAQYFSHQDHFFDEIPNIRKCYELPYQLNKSDQFKELTELLTDFSFLQAKFTADYSKDLLKDFMKAKEKISNGNYLDLSNELEGFSSLCQLRHLVLQKYPERIQMLALQQPKDSTVFIKAKSWFDKNNTPYLIGDVERSAEVRLIHEFDTLDNECTSLSWHHDGNHLLTMNGETLKCWSIHTGEEVYQSNLGLVALHDFTVSSFDHAIGVIGKNEFILIDSTSYEKLFELKLDEHTEKIISHPTKSLYAIIHTSGAITVIDWKKQSIVKIKDWDGNVQTAVWHFEKSELSILSDYGKVILWDLKQQSKVKILHTMFRPENILPSEHYQLEYDRKEPLLYLSDSHGVTVWNINEGVRENNTDNFSAAMHLIQGQRIVSILKNSEIKVWDIQSSLVQVSFNQYYFKFPKLASLHNDYLAVMTLEGKILLWDIREEQTNVSVYEKIPMLQESLLWVFKPFIFIFPNLLKLEGGRKVDLENSILTASISPNNSYIASSHLGEFVQIQEVEKKGIYRYKPFKNKEPILFCYWSYDGKVIVYGNFNKAWIMKIPSGRLLKTIEIESKLVKSAWSNSELKIVNLFSNGTVQLIDLKNGEEEEWKLVEGEHGEASWSTDGKKLAICIDKTFYLYDMSKSPKLIMQGDITNTIRSICWAKNNQLLVLMDQDFRVVFWSLVKKEIIYRFNLFSEKEKELENALFEFIQKNVETNVVAQLREATTETMTAERLVKLNGIKPMMVIHKDSNIIACGVGNWLKLFFVNDPKHFFTRFMEDTIYDMKWVEDRLLIYTGKGKIEEYNLKNIKVSH